MPKQISNKEKNKLSLLKRIKQKTAEVKENIKRQKQKNAPFKMLICAVNRNKGRSVTQFLIENGIEMHVLFFAQDYTKSNLQDVLGINTIDQDVIIALVDTKKTQGLLQGLSMEFNLNEENEYNFACLIPPSSATLGTIKALIPKYKKPIQL